MEHLEQFGRYLVLRQQRIYRAFHEMKVSIREQQLQELRNIYKDRSKKLYDHNFFDIKQNSSSGSKFDSPITMQTQQVLHRDSRASSLAPAAKFSDLKKKEEHMKQL